MSPSRQIRNLRDFLEAKTDLYNTAFHRVAESQFHELNKHRDTEGSLDEFIMVPHSGIAQETDRILMDMCKKIIAKNDYAYLWALLPFRGQERSVGYRNATCYIGREDRGLYNLKARDKLLPVAQIAHPDGDTPALLHFCGLLLGVINAWEQPCRAGA